MRRLRGLYILESSTFPLIYGPAELRDVANRVELIAPQQTRESVAQKPELLRDVQAIFSGWGAPLMDAAFLNQAPQLEVVFYAAGAVGSWMTESVWDRGVRVTSAYAANSVPVAEYTLASIIFGLKQAWGLARQTREQQTFVARDGVPGCYGSTVGLVSMGAIARRVIELLQMLDVNIAVYDPYLSETESKLMNVRRVGLDELFIISDVVSIHTPDLRETTGMITGKHISSMKPGACFINTARGAVVRQAEMVGVLQRRPDLQAVLDVCEPEPPEPGSPIYSLPNIMLTPHIAGSAGNECQRMGRYMVEELDRYLNGIPLRWEITPQIAARSSHRPMQRSEQGDSQPPVAIS